jgi:protein-tyrosine phosphatase
MRMGALFVILGVAMAALGLLGGGASLLWLWPATSFVVVGLGYLGLGARVTGKRADGTLPLWSRVLLAPYMGLAWLIWQALRRSRTVKPYALVAPRLYLSRRLHAHELPEDVTMVVDLTAEFDAPAALRAGRTYHALPSLDGHVPDEVAYRALVETVAASDATALIHCAAGHGRSATFMASVLVRRGLAADVDEAERLIRQTRPSIRIGPAQRALATRAARRG